MTRRLNVVPMGDGRRESNGWPSEVLHRIGPQMTRDGIDRRRLLALADVIEGLPSEKSGPVPGVPPHVLSSVDGRHAPGRFALRGGGQHGYGMVVQAGGSRVYVLTGFGLICWGWGVAAGMAAVATPIRVSAVQDVLTAEPVLNAAKYGLVRPIVPGEITAQHVAMALRNYVDCLKPLEAWHGVADALREGGQAETVPAVPAPAEAEPEPDDAGPDDAGPDDAGPDDAGPDDAGPDDADAFDVAAAAIRVSQLVTQRRLHAAAIAKIDAELGPLVAHLRADRMAWMNALVDQGHDFDSALAVVQAATA